jgi:uncharacterized protein DUF2865
MRTRTGITMIIAVLFAAGAVDAAVQSPQIKTAPMRDGFVQSAGLFDWLFGGSQPPQSEPQRPPPTRYPPRDEDEEDTPRIEPRRNLATYRTLCVRLCDGFYFPISFATTRNKFRADAERCERQCPSRSRLYVYRYPGESIEQMTDLNDEPYTKLQTAFRFQTNYDSQCTCHGNPWDAEAIARRQASILWPSRHIWRYSRSRRVRYCFGCATISLRAVAVMKTRQVERRTIQRTSLVHSES